VERSRVSLSRLHHSVSISCLSRLYLQDYMPPLLLVSISNTTCSPTLHATLAFPLVFFCVCCLQHRAREMIAHCSGEHHSTLPPWAAYRIISVASTTGTRWWRRIDMACTSHHLFLMHVASPLSHAWHTQHVYTSCLT